MLLVWSSTEGPHFAMSDYTLLRIGDALYQGAVIKFMFSKKATKIEKIFTGEDLVNFCGHLRKHALYLILQLLIRNMTCILMIFKIFNILYAVFFSFFRYSNRRTISSSDRTLINAFRTISGMCDRINLPRTITDRANALFKKVHDGKNLRGRSNDAISSGRKSLKLKNLVK